MNTKKIPVTQREFQKMFDEFKSDFIKLKDEIIGELKAVREEQEILSSQHGRVLDLEENVEKLQRIHPHNQHVSL